MANDASVWKTMKENKAVIDDYYTAITVPASDTCHTKAQTNQKKTNNKVKKVGGVIRNKEQEKRIIVGNTSRAGKPWVPKKNNKTKHGNNNNNNDDEKIRRAHEVFVQVMEERSDSDEYDTEWSKVRVNFWLTNATGQKQHLILSYTRFVAHPSRIRTLSEFS
jgi:hypothetical protein